jgi:AcrR family transcriptional regulator
MGVVSVTVALTTMQLPVLADEPPERADAARNRARVLAAAVMLFEERGADCVSMDEVAAAAGVGKGTLFRRFGDRAGLAQAVLDERERRFQEEVIRGPEPLGPGAPPIERLIAFGERVIEIRAQHLPLVLMAEDREARFRSGPFAFYRLHITVLVREADPLVDAEYVADVLLAALSAQLIAYMTKVREMSRERLKAGWAELVRRLLIPR